MVLNKYKIEDLVKYDLWTGVKYRLLVRQHLNSELIDKMIYGAIEFLILLVENKDLQLAPPELVDIAWHESLLDTKRYKSFCNKVFGCFINHEPPIGFVNLEQYPNTYVNIEKTIELASRLFGSLEEEVWNTKEPSWKNKPKFTYRTIEIKPI